MLCHSTERTLVTCSVIGTPCTSNSIADPRPTPSRRAKRSSTLTSARAGSLQSEPSTMRLSGVSSARHVSLCSRVSVRRERPSSSCASSPTGVPSIAAMRAITTGTSSIALAPACARSFRTASHWSGCDVHEVDVRRPGGDLRQDALAQARLDEPRARDDHRAEAECDDRAGRARAGTRERGDAVHEVRRETPARHARRQADEPARAEQQHADEQPRNRR